jgi:hypothetical protein
MRVSILFNTTKNQKEKRKNRERKKERATRESV